MDRRRLNLRSYSTKSFKTVKAKVDCRWKNGTPKVYKVEQNNKTRRKTENDCNRKLAVSYETENETDHSSDDVFEGSNVRFSTPFSVSKNTHESVTDHYERLFQHLEIYMKSAAEFDCYFIRHRVKQMKIEMTAINMMYKDLTSTGDRLEKFLENIGYETSNRQLNGSSLSVSDHYRRLFERLENYMKIAPEFDCKFISHHVDQMNEIMFACNNMFNDLIATGDRLKKFISDRQNNTNFSFYSQCD